MKNVEEIKNTFNLSDNVINIYSYGSQVYGTANELSDHDFFIVCQNGTVKDEFAVTKNNISCHFYNDNTFQDLLDRHKISAMECFFLPEEIILLNNKKFKFKVDLEKLRPAISEKASHSWVKAKKKFEVEKDRNVYIAKKSLFHSLRIIDFGSQIAKLGKIDNYSSSNYLWEDIYTDPNETWEPYKEKYQEIFNIKMTEFRKLAPK